MYLLRKHRRAARTLLDGHISPISARRCFRRFSPFLRLGARNPKAAPNTIGLRSKTAPIRVVAAVLSRSDPHMAGMAMVIDTPATKARAPSWPQTRHELNRIKSN